MTDRELRAILAAILGANDAGTCTRREWAGITVHDVDALLSEIDKRAPDAQNETADAGGSKENQRKTPGGFNRAESSSLGDLKPASVPAPPGDWPMRHECVEAFWTAMRSHGMGHDDGVQAVLDLCRSCIPARPIDPAKLLMDFNGEADAESIEDMRNALKMQEVSVREPVDAEKLAGHLRDFFYRDNVKSWVDVARLAIERCAGRSVEVDVVKLLTEHYGEAPAQTNLKSITRGLRAQGVAVKEASGG